MNPVTQLKKVYAWLDAKLGLFLDMILFFLAIWFIEEFVPFGGLLLSAIFGILALFAVLGIVTAFAYKYGWVGSQEEDE